MGAARVRPIFHHYPRTDHPDHLVLIAGALMCAFAVYHGLEVFARIAEIVFIVTMATFLIIYALLLNQYHPEYTLPVLENGPVRPLKGLMAAVSWFGDLMFVSMILKHVRHSSSDSTPHSSLLG